MMHLSSKIIKKNQLCKKVTADTDSYSLLIACALLIAYEFSSATKIQFNLFSSDGSLHIEYKDNQITYYQRNQFDKNSKCSLSVSIIQSIGNSYTSRVNSENALDCFSEYLKLSDQRGAKFVVEKNRVMKIEKLPPTKFKARSIHLEELDFKVIEIEE